VAITHEQAGTAATGSTSLSVPFPVTGLAAGDLFVLCICNKYPTNGPSTPTGFDALPSPNQASGGPGGTGTDVGDTYATFFTKVAVGTESGNVSVTLTSANSSVGIIHRFRNGTGIWELASASGSDNTGGTTFTFAGNQGWAGRASPVADLVLSIAAVNGDNRNWSGQDLTQDGIFYLPHTELSESSTSTGDDVELVVTSHLADFGFSTITDIPTFTMTGTGSGTNGGAGGGLLLRLREGAAIGANVPEKMNSYRQRRVA
jgi:MSHA biogenesis protein MshQ